MDDDTRRQRTRDRIGVVALLVFTAAGVWWVADKVTSKPPKTALPTAGVTGPAEAAQGQSTPPGAAPAGVLPPGWADTSAITSSAGGQSGPPTPQQRAVVSSPVTSPEDARLNAQSPEVVSPADRARLDAIAALKAVRSVANSGGAVPDFRRYYLEAQVKVDALDASPENAPIRQVAVIYHDALSLFVAAITRELSAAEVAELRRKYVGQPFPFMDAFGDISYKGFNIRTGTRNDQERGAISARLTAQALLIFADGKLSALK